MFSLYHKGMNNRLQRAVHHYELRLMECGKEKCIPYKRFHYDEKPYHLFHYVVEGSGTFVLEDKTYHLNKGAIFYIPPNMTANYQPNNKDPWTYIWLGMDGVNIARYLELIQMDQHRPIFYDNQNLLLLDHFKSIHQSYSIHGYLGLKPLGQVYWLIDDMLSMVHQKQDDIVSPQQRIVNSAIEFMNNNYQFPLTLVEIAQSINVSKNYFSQVFSSLMSVGPMKYLKQLRFDKAKALLKNPTLKIKEIAYMLGYMNQLHFSAEFKKEMNCSPLAYREQVNEQGVYLYE
jgi:AraC-like DNA-binding protein